MESQNLTRLLLDNGFNLSVKDLNKGEALVWAATENREELVQLLIEEGADVNYKHVKERENSACHSAARGGFCGILVLLKKAGADISAPNEAGLSPLHYAIINKRLEAVRLLITTLGAPVTCGDSHGWTPLHDAARKNVCEVLHLLHEAGSDINQRDHDGYSALHHACHCGALDATKALIAMGANVEWTTNDGATSLHTAVFCGKTEIV